MSQVQGSKVKLLQPQRSCDVPSLCTVVVTSADLATSVGSKVTTAQFRVFV